MKKILAVLLVLVMAVTFVACGAGTGDGGSSIIPEVDKTKNDNIDVEGIYVDNSFVDDDNSSLKKVYVFLNITATDKNLKVDCKYTKMTINESNAYESDFYKGDCSYAPSYYYSSFIEDVFVGDSIKLALTFEVPEGDLTAGKSITFTDTDMPFDGIEMTTDDIVACESLEQVCEKADPEGYAEEADKHAPADDATVAEVQNNLNGYYWEFYVTLGTNVQKHEIEFFAPNKFELRTNYSANGGTYEVKKGFIYITYDTNNHTVKIPYEFKDGELNLDCSTAFSIYE